MHVASAASRIAGLFVYRIFKLIGFRLLVLSFGSFPLIPYSKLTWIFIRVVPDSIISIPAGAGPGRI